MLHMTLHGCSSALGAPSIPPLQRICSCLPKDLGKAYVRTHCACRLQVVNVRQFSRSTLGFMTSARIASACITRPRFELGHSRRALPKPPPNEFDCNTPSSRGSLRPCITMYSTCGMFTPDISSSPLAPMFIMLGVFDDSVAHGPLSCRLPAPCETDLNKVSLSGSRLTVE